MDDIADTPGFVDALMKFQYGKGEESDQGFYELARMTLAQFVYLIRIESIAYILNNSGVPSNEHKNLKNVERAHKKFEELARDHGFF